MKTFNLIKEPEPIVFSKRKTLTVSITEEGKIIIKAPKHLSKEKVWTFINQKSDWINKKIEPKIKQLNKLKAHKLEEGVKIPFLGKSFAIKTQSEKNFIDYTNSLINLKTRHIENDEDKIKIETTKLYKKEARKIFEERVGFWGKIMKLKPTKIRISSAKTRWGSCTGKNVISLNWRLLLAPFEVLDYVVIHELAHIEQKNHSKKFWNLVEKFDPEWKRKRKWLKENGISLKLL